MMLGVVAVFCESRLSSLTHCSKVGKGRHSFLGSLRNRNNAIQFLREREGRQVLKISVSIFTYVLVKQVSICTLY